jgi:hypothetical protein
MNMDFGVKKFLRVSTQSFHNMGPRDKKQFAQCQNFYHSRILFYSSLIPSLFFLENIRIIREMISGFPPESESILLFLPLASWKVFFKWKNPQIANYLIASQIQYCFICWYKFNVIVCVHINSVVSDVSWFRKVAVYEFQSKSYVVANSVVFFFFLNVL